MKVNQGPDGIIRFYFDASSLKESGCLRKFSWTVIDGWVKDSLELSFSLGYGNAYHKFLERFYKDISIEVNLAQTRKDYEPMEEKLKYSDTTILTPYHLGSTCKHYYKTYGEGRDYLVPLRVGENFLIEQQFAFPIWQSKDGKIEILICGTIDFVGHYSNIECFSDHKTTQSYYREDYFEQYKFDVQMMLYSWALKKLLNLDRYLPCVVNGAFLKGQTEKAKKMNVWDGSRFERSPLIFFSNESMEEFEGWLKRRLGEIIAFFESEEKLKTMENFFDMSLCRNFGLCKFFPVCMRGKAHREGLLNTLFKQKPYEPLKFRT